MQNQITKRTRLLDAQDFNPRTREGCDSKHSQSLACLYSFITAYFTGFYKHPTHTKRGNGKKI